MVNKILFALVLPLVIASLLIAGQAPKRSEEAQDASRLKSAQNSDDNATDYKMLPGPGKKCWINTEEYFIYGFDKKPKLGTVILKIQVFAKSGEKKSPFEIKGQYDMPTMRGAHDSGLQAFKLSQKGDYLLPLNIMMPGEWEVLLTLSSAEKAVYYGRLKFIV